MCSSTPATTAALAIDLLPISLILSGAYPLAVRAACFIANGNKGYNSLTLLAFGFIPCLAPPPLTHPNVKLQPQNRLKSLFKHTAATSDSSRRPSRRGCLDMSSSVEIFFRLGSPPVPRPFHNSAHYCPAPLSTAWFCYIQSHSHLLIILSP